MRNGGHTLLELTVTVVILSVMVVVSARTWGPMNRSNLALRDRASAVAEMKTAVEYLRMDLAGAETALPEARDTLLIRRMREVAILTEDWDGLTDPGIRYYLDEGVVYRANVAQDVQVPVAIGMELFQVSRRGGNTEILLQSGQDLGERTLTLVWSE